MAKRKKTPVQYAAVLEAREAKQILRITPPEGVPLRFERASLMARFGAQFLDLLFTYGMLFLIVLVVFWSGAMFWDTAMAFFAVTAFLLRIPYYILTELVWNGQTLGKRIAKLRVIAQNGRRLEPHQVVVRNLMKEAEVFTPIGLIFSFEAANGWVRAVMALWLLVVILVPIFSKQSQRLGDMIAGTVVINNPRIQVAFELTEASKAVGDRFAFEPDQLEHYGRFELQSLEQILRENSQGKDAFDRDVKVAAAIRKKIGYTGPVQAAESRAFLAAFYAEQRAHLESRQMFGDRRENKYHRSESDS